MSLSGNVTRSRERISQAARRVGRNPDSVILMAASKTVEPERIRQAYQAGIRVFGENRVQEFAEKVAALKDLIQPAGHQQQIPPSARNDKSAELAEVEWHLIGHLQTNKAKKAVELFYAVDSVDSLRLAQKLDQAAKQAGKVLSVLIEINVGGEENKSGVAAGSPELEDLLQGARNLNHLQIRGLMTIPPYTDDPQAARPYFRKLRELRDSLAARNLPRIRMEVLSMGMSHDFEVAVEEGSTCVRVGTAIFGGRSKPQ